MTVTTSSSCILGVGEDFEILTKVIMVSDKRALKQVEYIKEQDYFNSEDIGISTSYTIPKILWFKDNMPLYKDVRHWLGAGEFLNYVFTGRYFTDSLNASKSFLRRRKGIQRNYSGKLVLKKNPFLVLKLLVLNLSYHQVLKGCMDLITIAGLS